MRTSTGLTRGRKLSKMAASVVVPALIAGSLVASPAAANNEQLRLPTDRPARGLVYQGLEPVTSGPNAGLFRIAGTDRFTHGPDAAPAAVDVASDPEPLSPSAAAAGAPQECDGDGSSGKRTLVLYARAADRPDRFATFEASIRAWAVDADDIYRDSAAETGGFRRVRFVHDSSCNIRVFNAVMDSNGDDSFGDTINELDELGFDRTDRKYMVFVDANVYCGIGSIDGDDSTSSSNVNNVGPDYGRTDAGCWGGSVAAHEHMHNLGGVQLNAPHTSGGWHCTDEYDRMCYSDLPNFPAMTIVQPDTGHDRIFDVNHDDYFHTSPGVGNYLKTHWNTASSGFLVGGSQALWGFVWANQPTTASYTPNTLYQFNSKGLTNTIARSAVGDYTVRFRGLANSQGTVNVTAYGPGTQSCKVAHWVPSGSDLLARVRCFHAGGSTADTQFTASFVKAASGMGPIGYVWANEPATASYTPAASYRFNSTGGTNTITRSGVGAYTVRMPGLGASAGNVKVTAYGAGSESCKVLSWGPSRLTQLINVRCFHTSGRPVDTRFTATFTRNVGVLGLPGWPTGYVWADQPSAASYTPWGSYQFNSVPGSTNTIVRTGVGDYTVRLPNIGAATGHVQVSAYGPDPHECKVQYWVPSGDTQQVRIRCFTTAGAPVDSRFTATYFANKWL